MTRADISTLVVPPAIWRAPRCPACGGVLTFEEQPALDEMHLPPVWGCEPCALLWPDGPGSDGKHADPERLCDRFLRPFDAGLNRQPSYRDAVYQCIRPAGHEKREYPGGLCAGFLIVGSNGIPRSRTWSVEAVAR